MAAANPRGSFAEASQQVRRRLMIASWLDGLARSAPYVYGVSVAVGLGLAMTGTYILSLSAAVALVFIHLALTAVWVWLWRPSPTAALAEWDERAGRREMFTSAYCFESLPHGTAGQQLHMQRARQRLARDLSALSRDIPASLRHRAWLAPLVFLVLASTVLAAPTPRRQARVDAEARKQARHVAKSLADRKRLDESDTALTKEEQEKVEQLEKSVDDTVTKLNELDNETRREVLKQLEQRANAAEELARKLGGAEGDPDASELIAELARHADTADFAAALKAEDLEKMEAEANRLAARLEKDDLTYEEQNRIRKALDKALRKANSTDKKTNLAKQLRKAKSDLQDNKPRLASKRMRDLARQYQRGLQRRAKQQQLRQLARQLRSAGQNIFGQRQAGIRRLARTTPQGMQRLGATQLQRRSMLLQRRPTGPQSPLVRATGQPSQGPLVRGQLPIPGQGQMPGQCQAPIPGLGQMPGQGQAPIPGQGNCPGGQCPIPGQGQGQSPGQGQGQGQGQGAGQLAGQGAGVGGHQAGHGTAGLGGGSKSTFKAAKADRVNARISGQGPAMVRSIDPNQHQEGSRLNLQEVAAATLAAEEEALADEPLPLSRRDQVLRYFTALRRQLSTDDDSADK